MEDILEYSYPMTWEDSQTEEMRGWLANTWAVLDGEEPDQDFLDYVMVMIKTKKKMGEIQSELTELGVDEGPAKEFATLVGGKLKEIANNQKPAVAKTESKIVSMVSTNTSDKRTLGPLKTSRAGEHIPQQHQSNSSSNSGSSRLLQSALQSSRGGGVQAGPRPGQPFQQPNARGGMNNHGAGVKRGYNDIDNNVNRNYREQDDQQQRGRRDVVMPGGGGMQGPRPGMQQPGPAIPTPLSETVQYFEQMNKVAQASGFKNAQEMLASQKEMMAMMHGAAVPMAPGPMAAGFVPPFAGGPPPPPAYPPQQFGGYGGYQGRGGRGFGGRGGRAWEGAAVEGGRGGWGRGRGGRGPPPVPTEGAPVAAAAAPAEGAAEGQAAVTAPAAPVDGAPEGAPAEGGAPFQGGRGYQGRGGRGWGRGRGQAYDPTGGQGRFGRGYGRGGGRFYQQGAAPEGGAAPTGHKTWVRTPDMDSALVTGR